MQQQQFDQLTTAEKREVERQLHLYMDGAEEVIPRRNCGQSWPNRF